MREFSVSVSADAKDGMSQPTVGSHQTELSAPRQLLRQPYATLLPPLVTGAAVVAYRLLSDRGHSPDWPLGAATIISALIIAATLEGSLFMTRRLWPGVATRRLTNVLWFWPVVALLIASARATEHHAFSWWQDAFVAGGIATLVVTVGNLASFRASGRLDAELETPPDAE